MDKQLLFETKGIETYFVDLNISQKQFRSWLTTPTLLKPLLIIYGIGGIGKTTLLHMFRMQCKNLRVPVAIVSSLEGRSPVDILINWSDDLKNDGVELRGFSKTFKRYLSIQAKVDEKMREKQTRLVDSEGKSASITAETAADGAAAGAVIGAVIPGIKSIGSALGSMGAEALVIWLRKFLTKSDIDLLLDPTRTLTNIFLGDIAKNVSKKRIVLMLDGYEQINVEDWVCDLIKRLLPNVLFVIAGRTIPNWDQKWPGWLMYARVEELQPMSDEDIRTLVRRYYAIVFSDEPDYKQVEAITKFARGLPMVATSAVRLWIKYGVKDYQAIEAQIIPELKDQLLRTVSKDMLLVLDAATVLPWFNKASLLAVSGLKDIDPLYTELLHFSFVRPRREGLALHDNVRDILKQDIRLRNQPHQYQALLERAIAYYRATIGKLEEYKESLTLSGEINAEEMTLRYALGDATFELGLLLSKQDRWYDALQLLEESLVIRRQSENLGPRTDTIYQIARINHLMGNLEKARIHYRDALRLYIHLDNPHGIAACKTSLGRLMIQLGSLDDALRELKQAKQIYRRLGDNSRIIEIEEVLQVASRRYNLNE